MTPLKVAVLVCGAVAAVAGACGVGAGPSALPSSPPRTPASVETPPPSAVRHVVIDTDMAPDDWIAILYLLGRADISVDAITVTGTGEAHCAPGIEHAHGLAALAGQPDIPVACGRETPLASDHAFPDEWRQGVDDLLGLTLPDGSIEASDESAPDLLTRIVVESADGVTLLTLGPLTNVAEALQADPSLGDKIEAIYAMGGAVEVDGNVGISIGIDNQFAEWNIYADPHAAKIVLESGVPVTLVPLDATNEVPITAAFADSLKTSADSESAEFVSQVLTQRMPFILDGGYDFWDPFAAAVLVDEGLTSFQSASLTVETVEGPDSGRIIEVASGPEVRFAASANRHEFEQELLTTLNGR
ncbi:MAG: nucleoside hydrolase [Candidatus Limnocylindrales bacterium]